MYKGGGLSTAEQTGNPVLHTLYQLILGLRIITKGGVKRFLSSILITVAHRPIDCSVIVNILDIIDLLCIYLRYQSSFVRS